MRRLWRDNRKLELGLGSSISICRRSNRGIRMTSGTQTSEVFLCPKCSLGYRAIRVQFPVRRASESIAALRFIHGLVFMITLAGKRL